MILMRLLSRTTASFTFIVKGDWLVILIAAPALAISCLLLIKDETVLGLRLLDSIKMEPGAA